MHWVRDRRDRWISDEDDAALVTEAAMLDEIERLRAAGDALADALRAMTRLGAPPDMNEWVTWQLSVADPALNTYMGGPS
jgi:hypothetical protein